MPENISDPLRLTMALVASLETEYPVDTNRLYVTGLSMGGYGTWDAIQRFPAKFAAAVPVCGGGDATAAKAIAKVPVWAFHGAKDTAVKPERSRDMIAALKAAGGAPKYTEYPDVGHNSWVNAYNTPELYEWMFAQKLPPKP
jgi:predicted peptidase